MRVALIAILLLSCNHADPGSERGPCAANRACNGGLICLSELCVKPPADCPAVASHLTELNIDGKREALVAACGERNLDAAALECLVHAQNPEEAARCPGAADAHDAGFWVTPSCHDVAVNMVKLQSAPGTPEAETKKNVSQVETDCQRQAPPAKVMRCLSRAANDGEMSACMQASQKRVPLTTKTGVAECDSFVTQMVACIAKMPAESRKPMGDSMEVTLAAWQDAAASPEGKAALAKGCKQAIESSANSYKQIGCTFSP